MTRETRIGLLVGLAFIVTFGLVLSELTDTNELAAPPAPQAKIREASPQAIMPIVVPPRRVEAPAPVVAMESADPQSVVQSNLVARGESGSQVVIAQMTSSQGSPAQERVPVLAAQHMEAIPQIPRVPIVPMPQELQPAAQAKAQVYVVQPNDSLRKIAGKVYGPGKEEQYRLIFEANRQDLRDESVVLVGQELVIPPLAAASSPRSTVPAPAVTDRRNRPYQEMNFDELAQRFDPAKTPPARQPLNSGKRTYVVRQGDNLTGIARKTLNDSSQSAVMKIYNANRDKLSSPNVLPVGAELCIPS
jgi:nucleoid-associated protein YgaU